MNVSGKYLVVGKRMYREHRPGTLFEAKLDAKAEARAIGRGDIKFVERIVPALRPGSYRLPRKVSDG
jgi:hypothetical protein